MRPRSPLTHRTKTSNAYLNAKTLAHQLIQDCALFSNHQLHHYHQQCHKIASKVKDSPDVQKGQIYLLLCQSAMLIGVRANSLGLPNNFVGDIVHYLASLLDVAPRTTRQSSGAVPYVYTHRYRSPQPQLTFEPSKSKLKDHMLIDRYDQVIFFVLNQYHQEGLSHMCRLPKQLIIFLRSTYSTASKYLSASEYEEYNTNIQNVIDIGKEYKNKDSSSRSAPKAYVLIDKDTVVPQTFGLRKKPASTKKYSSLHRCSSQFMKISVDGVDNNRLTNQQDVFKKSLLDSLSLKRGSAASNISKRTSRQQRQTGFITVSSNLKSSIKSRPRASMNFINKISNVEGKLERKSRFQVISKLEAEALQNEFGCFDRDENESGSDESRQLKIKKKISRACSYKEQTAIFQFRAFILFGEREGVIEVWIVEHHKQEGQVNGIYFEAPKLKITNLQRNYSIFIIPIVSTLNQDEIENQCRHYIVNSTRVATRSGQMTLEEIPVSSQQTRQSQLIKYLPPTQQILIGFIRKISNYFIQLSRYQLSQLGQHYNIGLKKNLLTPNRPLNFSLKTRHRLMNCELTMSFQEEEEQTVTSGSIINYIQMEEDHLNQSPLANDAYKLSQEYCTLRELEEVFFRPIWICSLKYFYEMMPKRKRGRRFNNSKISRSNITDEIPRRLRRTAHNTSSIKVHGHSPEFEMLRQESEFSRMSKLHSRRDMSSEKRVRLDYNMPVLMTKAQVAQKKKMLTFVETIATDKGYRLRRMTAQKQLDGYHYSQYQGYLERNPQNLRFWKNKQQTISYTTSLKSSLTIHNNNRNKVQNRKLITFVKPLKSNNMNIGYLVSSIKIFTLSPNHSIFIQSYSDKMQKYFLFNISSELFSKITDINTESFWEKPFVMQEQKPQKKIYKRVSVLFNIRQRSVTTDALKQLEKKSKINRQASLKSNSNSNHDQEQQRSRFKDKKKLASSRLPRVNSTTTRSQLNSKAQNVCSQQLGVTAHIKSKLLKCMFFEWENHTLRLTVNPTNLNTQDELKEKYVFEGRQLAIKNVHESKQNPQISEATELILLKYQESNLVNLSCFTPQGLSKISLEHIYIKNNQSLYSCYYDILNLSILPFDHHVQNYYLNNNNFFQTKPQIKISRNITRMKATLSKVSVRDDQKRYKYADIINFAKECILPFSFIENKRKSYTRKSFIVPNRYPLLQEEQQILLYIQMREDGIAIEKMDGQQIIDFKFRRMEPYFPHIRNMGVRQKRDVLLKRVLVDEDLVRLCTY